MKPQPDFNSRPSARGDTAQLSTVRRITHFNSRPSARGDRPSVQCRRTGRISIHAPPRGATLTAAVHAAIAALFQFTPLREGRLCARRKARKSSRFQFTPLREGRPPTFTPDAEKLRISIHAPPRGATVIQELRNIVTRISIHAPPRGATFLRSLCCSNFYQISIHAPPRGATGLRRGGDLYPRHFNSRPSARGDHIDNACDPRYTFQFTPLREGRRTCTGTCTCNGYFNSRPSARGDANLCAMAALRDISIHAPPRGATGQNAEERRGTYFNSRPSARGDRAIPGEGQHVVISIHAPPRGATELP